MFCPFSLLLNSFDPMMQREKLRRTSRLHPQLLPWHKMSHANLWRDLSMKCYDLRRWQLPELQLLELLSKSSLVSVLFPFFVGVRCVCNGFPIDYRAIVRFSF